MPSSLIFVGLVVIWLLILVPAVARHRQEVARPSVAALSGRVLERPRRRQSLEVDLMDDVQQSRSVATRTDRDHEPPRVPVSRVDADALSGPGPEQAGGTGHHDARWDAGSAAVQREQTWASGPDRARVGEDGPDSAWADVNGPGQGWADPEGPDREWAEDDEPGRADADTPDLGWAGDGTDGSGSQEWVDGPDGGRWERPPPRFRPGRGGFDPEAAALAAHARYTFRQRVVLTILIVAIVTGVLAAFALPVLWWSHAAADLALVGYLVYLRRQVRMEESIRERRAARMAGTRRPPAADDPELDEWARRGHDEVRADPDADDHVDVGADVDGPARLFGPDAGRGPARPDDLEREAPERVTGVGVPLREADTVDLQPALPRLQPAPPPPLPPGTAVVEADDTEPDLPELEEVARPGYRRAAGE